MSERVVLHEPALRAHPRVTVIVPVKNEAEKLGRCLGALRGQTLPPVEILVVDGHSTDATTEVARAHGATVLYEDQGTRAAACQIGVEHARGDLVAFTDADCVPDADWLQVLAEEIARPRERRLAGVGCTIVNVGDKPWERAINASQTTLLGSGNSVQGREFAGERHVVSISGCHSMYRREDLLRVGGFRADLKTCEDTELNLRLRRQVGPLLYTPRTRVLHDHKRGLRLFVKRMRQYGAGRAQARLFGVPVLLPLSVPVGIVLLALAPLVALALAAVYLGSILATGATLALRHREPGMAHRVPAVLALQHAAYCVGFWGYALGLKR